ncbi:MAG: peptidoglycan DD-metalloendopeptidase family protein [Leptolyngbyaceae cyanobacterium]
MRPQLPGHYLSKWTFSILCLGLGLGGLVLPWESRQPLGGIAQAAESLCPEPALARLTTHTVQAGETIDSIAAAHNLLPVTLLAMNPATQPGTVAPGTTLKIPPFNGAAVTVVSGQTWQDLALAYGARADVLFEVNGCPASIPEQIFVPGVSWLLENSSADSATMAENNDPLSIYPLAAPGNIVGNYGWQTDAEQDALVFSSGVTIAAPNETSVVAAGRGTVAYVGEEGALGLLIVVNHDQGVQTRYAQVREAVVAVGDAVQAGQPLAIATPTVEDTSQLYFEVRTNSALGWVARDPGLYIPELAVR